MPAFKLKDLMPEPVAPQADIDRTQMESPSYFDRDIWGAAFGDKWYSALRGATGGFADQLSINRQIYGNEEEGYDPFEDLQIKGYELYAGDWVNSRSRAETRTIIQGIDRVKYNRQLLQEGGAPAAVAQLSLGVLDPLNFVPLGVFAKSLQTGKFFAGAVEGAAANAAASTIDDAIRRMDQGSQLPFAESVLNIGGDTLLGAVLGGGVGLLGKGGFKGGDAIADALHADLADAVGTATRVAGGEAQSAGAAAVRKATKEELTPKFSGGAGELAAANTPMQSPTAAGIRSESVNTRRTTAEMSDIVEHLRGEDDFVAAAPGGSVEARAKYWHQGAVERGLTALDEQFQIYRFGRAAAGPLRGKFMDARAGIGDLLSFGKGPKLSKEAFNIEVSKASRRGDQHEIPEVATAARRLREEITDPLKREAMELGGLPADVAVTTAQSYLSRIYDVGTIIRKRGEFKRLLTSWLAEAREAERNRDPAQVKQWESLRDLARENVKKFADGKLIDEANAEVLAAGRSRKRTDADLRRLGRAKAQRDTQLAQAGRELVRAADRRRTIRKRTDKLDEADPLNMLIDDARTMKEPVRLSDEVRAIGGIRDENDVLKDAGFKPVPASGKPKRNEIIADPGDEQAPTLSATSRKMMKFGYFEREVGEPVNESFVDALASDVKGGKGKVYAEFGEDAEVANRWREVEAFRKELSDEKIPLDIPNEEIAYRLAATDAPFGGRTRAAGDYEKRIQERIASHDAEEIQGGQEIISAKIKRTAAEEAHAKARTRAEELLREHNASKRQNDRYGKALAQHKEMLGLDDGHFADIADQLIDGILKSDGRGLHQGIVLERGPLKERTLNIRDDFATSESAFEDFLENDIERIMRMHARTMGTDVEMLRKFGSYDLKDQKDNILSDYRKLVAEAEQKFEAGPKREKRLAALNSQMKNDIAIIDGMRDRLRGTANRSNNPEGFWNRANILARNLNLARLSGGFLPASVSDVGSIALTHGLMRMFGKDGLGLLIKSMKATKMLAREVRGAGVANDLTLDTRNNAYADIMDDYGRHSAVERTVKALADKSGLVNLMSIWNTKMKQWTGIVTMQRMTEAIEKFGKGQELNVRERGRLAYLGINPELAEQIARQLETHGTDVEGVRVPNVDEWTNPEAKAAYRAAIAKEVDTTIVTPGQEKPFWMSTQEGRTAAQFRSFTISSLLRVTGRGLQQRDFNTLQGMMLMTALGMMSYRLKTKDEDLSEDPAVWVKEGIERAGLLSWLADANTLIEKGTGGNIGVGPMLGLPPSRRNQAASFWGELLGPTYRGISDDILPVMKHITEGRFTDSDAHKASKMVPFQNLFYLRWLINQASDDEAQPAA